jgi:SGNH domain-containing protein
MRAKRRRTAGELLVAALLVATLVAEWTLLPDGSDDAAGSPDAATADAAAPHRPRVLLVGDSIADQLASHALPALEQAGIDAEVAAWWGWGLLTPAQYDRGTPNPDPPAGSMMAEVTASVDDFDPDVVAVYVNHNYWPPYPTDAAGHEIAYGSPAFTEMVHAQITELVHRLSAGGARVYLVQPVPGREGTAAHNPIWNGYLDLRAELGFGVINAGDVLTTAADQRLDRTGDCAGEPVELRAPDRLHLSYHGAGMLGTRVARALADIVGVPLQGATAVTEAPAALVPVGSGYRLVTCDGSTFRGLQTGRSLAAARFDGGRRSGDPVVAATTVGGGERGWVVTRSGHVGSLGRAARYSDVAGLGPGDAAVGIAATASGHGYWVTTTRGAVHAVGDADDVGDLAGQLTAGETVVGMAATRDRGGYWLLTSAGRVAAFGSARWLGDLQGPPGGAVGTPVAIAAQANGDGYWILDRGGGVHPFGTAGQHGSAAGVAHDMLQVLGWDYPDGGFQTEPVDPTFADPVAAATMLSSPSGAGYWVQLTNGAVCHFGDAAVLGGLHRAQLDNSMRLQGLAFYGQGPCTQQPGDVLASPDETYVPSTG